MTDLVSRKQGLPMRVLALGATSAIAEATLRPLAEAGASFYLVARNPQKVAAVRDDLLTRGAASATAVIADLDVTADHPAIVADAIRVLGSIDLALIAHGILGHHKQAHADFRAAEPILHTNFISAASLANELANSMEGQGHGTIAVISSVAGDRGRGSSYVYCASKGGLNIFLDGLRHRLCRTGVQVLTIKPGFVATPMTAYMAPTPLFAQPWQVARDILDAVRQRKAVVYTPHYWAVIMLIVRKLPSWLFHRTRL